MNTVIIIITVIVSIIGLVMSVQTLIDTRNKNYNDFINKKKGGKKEVLTLSKARREVRTKVIYTSKRKPSHSGRRKPPYVLTKRQQEKK